MSDVKLLALWEGWCDPCATERPLALTEHGQRGLRAWLSGVGTDERTLVLACEVCGQWQSVPQYDEDDEPGTTEAADNGPLITSTGLVIGRSVVIAPAVHAAPAGAPVTTFQLPTPRRTDTPIRATRATSTTLLTLVSEGFDVVGAGAA
jgi:hypothetical protein